MSHKLVVVSMDALFYEDLAYLSQKPTFRQLLNNCAMVRQVKSIYPTLTYPCLVSIGSVNGSHGYHPEKGSRHPLLAMGPAFAKGVVLPQAHLTDGAPTWAKLLDVSLPDTDGTALTALLR